ncbi:hypothetical protein BV898_19629 [Hypsibius exemplaris]|uniref:Uncharacterized protein n=1 Tax=Hypsibius exemplaris TaxID=2072580 RepID=A0A9X6NR44_HYPEX|nr:hypothetical protein BV898_19629 [Hypsibius exemplaris]
MVVFVCEHCDGNDLFALRELYMSRFHLAGSLGLPLRRFLAQAAPSPERSSPPSRWPLFLPVGSCDVLFILHSSPAQLVEPVLFRRRSKRRQRDPSRTLPALVHYSFILCIPCASSFSASGLPSASWRPPPSGHLGPYTSVGSSASSPLLSRLLDLTALSSSGLGSDTT